MLVGLCLHCWNSSNCSNFSNCLNWSNWSKGSKGSNCSNCSNCSTCSTDQTARTAQTDQTDQTDQTAQPAQLACITCNTCIACATYFFLQLMYFFLSNVILQVFCKHKLFQIGVPSLFSCSFLSGHAHTCAFNITEQVIVAILHTRYLCFLDMQLYFVPY